jgi:MSHA biogenesis protein MshK
LVKAGGGEASLIRTLLVALAGLLFFGPAMAQAMRDPMRPPVPANSEGAGAETAVSSGLQIVRTSGGVRTAVIDGMEVKVGGKVAGSTLVSLTESTAVLRSVEGQLTTLKMFPQSEKIVPVPVDAAPKRPVSRSRKKQSS